MITIAAVIPTYNAAAFIEGTLASVFSQARQPDEVIVVDDASTDNTLEIVKKYPVKCIGFQVNMGGPGPALNTGICANQCDWIAILDHDDRWHPGWLAGAEQSIRDSDVPLFFGRVKLQPPNPDSQAALDRRWDRLRDDGVPCGTRTWRIERSRAYNELVQSLSFAVTCSNMVFQKQLGERTGFASGLRTCCDYQFLQDVAENNDVGFINDYSCDWVKSENSLYQSGTMDRLDRELYAVFEHFKPSLLTPQSRLNLKERMRRTACDLAFAARERGDYRQALADYWVSLRCGGLNIQAFAGIAKLPFAMLRGRQK